MGKVREQKLQVISLVLALNKFLTRKNQEKGVCAGSLELLKYRSEDPSLQKKFSFELRRFTDDGFEIHTLRGTAVLVYENGWLVSVSGDMKLSFLGDSVMVQGFDFQGRYDRRKGMTVTVTVGAKEVGIFVV